MLSSRAIKQEIDAFRTGHGKRQAPNFEKKLIKKETELVISRFFCGRNNNNNVRKRQSTK